MATITLKSSNWDSDPRLKVTYTISGTTLIITELSGWRTANVRSYDASLKSAIVKIGSTTKTISLSKYIDFPANSVEATWGATDTSWTGLSEIVNITITMPSDTTSTLGGAKFTGQITVTTPEQTPAPELANTGGIVIPYIYTDSGWMI